MDLSQLSTAAAYDDGFVMQVIHPALGPIEGMTITLAGQDSKRYLEAQRAIADKRLARQGKPLTAKDLESEDVAGLAAVTIAWTGFERGGHPVDCTETEAKRVYVDHGFAWLRRQVQEAVHTRANFLKTSPDAS
ncbi:MAG TPA: hypothetical protein VKB09_03960 [Thermomicrobiales bacterium]|nr:hypothetical protein [Thermomicrobiales bacterium]